MFNTKMITFVAAMNPTNLIITDLQRWHKKLETFENMILTLTRLNYFRLHLGTNADSIRFIP